MTDIKTIKKAGKLIKAGWRNKDIAAYLNVTESNVCHWRKALGIPSPTLARCIRDCLPVMADSEIVKRYGVSRQHVWKLRRQGA